MNELNSENIIASETTAATSSSTTDKPAESSSLKEDGDEHAPKTKSYFHEFIKGVASENPVFRLALGACATLAVSTSAKASLGMGLSTTFVLLFSNITISLLRKIIPDKVRLPAYIVIIATFTTIVQLLLKAYLPLVDKQLGIYLPLIAVNCIIFGRAEAFASKNTPLLSALDGLGMGIGFTVALVSIGVIREFFGNGTIFGNTILLNMKVAFFVFPAGGFFVFGLLIWLTNTVYKLVKREDNRKIISTQVCAACPHSDSCSSYSQSQSCDGDGDRETIENKGAKS